MAELDFLQSEYSGFDELFVSLNLKQRWKSLFPPVLQRARITLLKKKMFSEVYCNHLHMKMCFASRMLSGVPCSQEHHVSKTGLKIADDDC